MSANKEIKPKTKSVEAQLPRTYVQVERGIYRYKDSQNNITYHERVKINGKRTKRSLGFNFTPQKSLKYAREEYQRRRSAIAAGENPYVQKEEVATEKEAEVTISGLLKLYRDGGYPDRYLRKRQGRMLEIEKRHCATLLEYWGDQRWDALTTKLWRDYHDWRVKRVPGYQDPNDAANISEKSKGSTKDSGSKNKPRKPIEGRTGDRTVDQERNTMINAFKYAINEDLIDSNPAKALPRFQPPSEVKHCREFCPRNADELHAIASLLFANRKSETLGWQMMFEAMTGLRTTEVLAMRMDAKPDELGHIRTDGNMDVGRCKKGRNPYVYIHSGFKKVLKAHAAWHAARYPHSPWYFPGLEEPELKPLGIRALAHRLNQLRRKIGRKITSHGMRAFYVLIRRSQNISDAIIAWEIGHTTGGAVIESTYGSAPASWANGGGPNLKWLPEGKFAWESIRPYRGSQK